MKGTSILPLILALLLIAAAPITVNQGETAVLTANTGSRDTTDTIAAEFVIPRTEVNHYVLESNPTSPIIRQPVTFDLPVGTYEMRIRTWVNNQLTNYDTMDVTVRSSITARPTIIQPGRNQDVIIHIEPIPDATPGTTFIVPVIVTGNGVYTVEIPKLPFGTYEVPPRIILDGTQMVPVLLHIDEDAEAGTYAIPITIGDESASARLRIIRYQERDMSIWWLLIPLGIILIVIGILVLLSRKPRAPRTAESTTTTTESKEMITYY